MASVAEKLKVPGESTTNPSFASPNIQTAPDVATSQKVAGKAETPPTPNGQPPSPTTIPQTGGAAPTAPKASATVTSAAPAASSVPTVPTTSGAPPGVPDTATMAHVPAASSAGAPAAVPPPPTVGEAPTLKSIIGKNAAEDDWIQAQNEQAMRLYEAALAYNGGPTGALEEAQRRATENLRGATNNRGAAGTIESSLYGEDKGRISTAQATADTKAYTVYQEAIAAANEALNKAQVAYQRAQEQEKREIAEAAERREQTEAMERASAASAAPPPAAAPPPIFTNPGYGPQYQTYPTQGTYKNPPKKGR